MNVKRALITGITGQDGSFLAELLLAKGYEVHGVVRRASTFNTGRLDPIYADPHERGARLFLHYGDIANGAGILPILEKAQPDEIYNLAAQSQVRVSFDLAEYTADVVATGAAAGARSGAGLRRASGIRRACTRRDRRKCSGPRRRRRTNRRRFIRAAPTRASKVAAHWYAVNYREAYGLFIANGILFNHESPRRGETFVTRKITRALARIKLGLQEKLYLGNLDARRDWGYAGDYVEAMWRILQQPEPEDFVIATGESHSVREFLDLAAAHCGVDWTEPRRTRSPLFPPDRG